VLIPTVHNICHKNPCSKKKSCANLIPISQDFKNFNYPDYGNKKLSFNEMEEIKGGSSYGHRVVCNLTTGGLGTIYGAWAGGIAFAFGATAIATGGITILVGLAVGAALSAAIC